jgi:hypothetical protein
MNSPVSNASLVQTYIPRFFLSEAEAQWAADFQAWNDDYFSLAPRFGCAGGPNVVVLSEKGRQRAYDMACIYRLKLSASDINTLETVNAYGVDGVVILTLPRDIQAKINRLTFLISNDVSSKMVAASLGNDIEEYGRLREVNQLISVSIKDGHLTYRTTALGKELVHTAHIVGAGMIRARETILEQLEAGCTWQVQQKLAA